MVRRDIETTWINEGEVELLVGKFAPIILDVSGSSG